MKALCGCLPSLYAIIGTSGSDLMRYDWPWLWIGASAYIPCTYSTARAVRVFLDFPKEKCWRWGILGNFLLLLKKVDRNRHTIGDWIRGWKPFAKKNEWWLLRLLINDRTSISHERPWNGIVMADNWDRYLMVLCKCEKCFFSIELGITLVAWLDVTD